MSQFYPMYFYILSKDHLFNMSSVRKAVIFQILQEIHPHFQTLKTLVYDYLMCWERIGKYKVPSHVFLRLYPSQSHAFIALAQVEGSYSLLWFDAQNQCSQKCHIHDFLQGKKNLLVNDHLLLAFDPCECKEDEPPEKCTCKPLYHMAKMHTRRSTQKRKRSTFKEMDWKHFSLKTLHLNGYLSCIEDELPYRSCLVQDEIWTNQCHKYMIAYKACEASETRYKQGFLKDPGRMFDAMFFCSNEDAHVLHVVHRRNRSDSRVFVAIYDLETLLWKKRFYLLDEQTDDNFEDGTIKEMGGDEHVFFLLINNILRGWNFTTILMEPNIYLAQEFDNTMWGKELCPTKVKTFTYNKGCLFTVNQDSICVYS